MSRNELPNPNSSNFLTRLREEVQTYLGRQGDPLDRGLTLRDLLEGGVVKLRSGFSLKPGQAAGLLPLEPAIQEDAPDLTPPPQPTGFSVGAAIGNIFIEHDAPTYLQGGGHKRTRVYGVTVAAGPLPTFADAVEITQFTGKVHAHPSNPATTWRLWIKWETNDGVLSPTPAGGTNGLEAITGEDVSLLLDALASELDASGNPVNPDTLLIKRATATVINGVSVPAGVYMKDAYVQNGTITNAKIANLAVDNAKISSVAVDKLTAGSMSVDQYIQSTSYVAGTSGWKINADGTAELANATIRGAVYASSGSIGGVTVASNSVRAGQTAFNSGIGFYIGGDGKFSIGNSDGNSLTWDNTDLKIKGAVTALSGSIGGSDIGATFIRSTNYSAGASGWQIKSDGSAEFNGVVLSRNQIAASGTLDLGLINFTSLGGGRYEAGPFIVNTGITIAAWSSGTNPYVALSGTSGIWYQQTSTVASTRYWGVKTEAIPWTNWEGTSYIWLSFMIYAQNMIKADPCKIDWKVYKVT